MVEQLQDSQPRRQNEHGSKRQQRVPELVAASPPVPLVQDDADACQQGNANQHKREQECLPQGVLAREGVRLEPAQRREPHDTGPAHRDYEWKLESGLRLLQLHLVGVGDAEADGHTQKEEGDDEERHEKQGQACHVHARVHPLDVVGAV